MTKRLLIFGAIVALVAGWVLTMFVLPWYVVERLDEIAAITGRLRMTTERLGALDFNELAIPAMVAMIAMIYFLTRLLVAGGLVLAGGQRSPRKIITWSSPVN